MQGAPAQKLVTTPAPTSTSDSEHRCQRSSPQFLPDQSGETGQPRVVHRSMRVLNEKVQSKH